MKERNQQADFTRKHHFIGLITFIKALQKGRNGAGRITMAGWMAAIFLLTLPIATHAQYAYTITNGSVTITRYFGPGGAVAIPSTINGRGVTSIGDYAFERCNSLTSVTIPPTVIYIGHYAFQDCDNLTSVTIPGSVISAGDYVFSSCDKLVSVTIGYGVTEIWYGAFRSCKQLTSVAIPASVNRISTFAFYHCDSLTGIEIPSSVTSMGHEVFIYCAALSAVWFQGDAPHLDGDDLFDYSPNVTVYYVSGTTGWGGTFSGRPTALYYPPQYNILLSSNPSVGGRTSGGGVATQGSLLTVSATANNGYYFVNWTENGAVVSTGRSYTFTAIRNRTLVANFKQFAITPIARAHPAAGAAGQSFNVSANVPWTATVNAAWIVITSFSSGAGNGTVTYSVAPNVGAIRSGTITVTGGGISRTFMVNQWPASTHPLVSADGDFDGDFKADIATFQPSSGNWDVLLSTGTRWTLPFGSKTTVPVPADYDGDGMIDFALYQRSTGFWFILNSGGGSRKVTFGPNSAMVPLPRDYDGDGRADLALFYPAQARWYFWATTEGYSSVQFGGKADIPVPADYDGDGATDLAVYRPSSGYWYIIYSGGGSRVTQLGWAGTVPVPADYDGDGKADLAILNRATSKWCINYSGGGSLITTFGYKTMTPVPADYDGDGKADVAMYHPASGSWFIRQSSTLSTRKVVHGGPDRIPVLLYPLIYSWFGLP